MTNETEKTHYRKAFNSPYLSAADITEPTVLTISRVSLEGDKSKKTKDVFNTAYFAEREIRRGEELKPLILNATNSRTMKELTGSAFIDDWQGVRVTVYVEHGVKFGRDYVDGLRISPVPVAAELPELTPELENRWKAAKVRFAADGHLDKVLKSMRISPENQQRIADECKAEAVQADG